VTTPLHHHSKPFKGRSVSVRLRGTPSSVAKARACVVRFASDCGFKEDQLFDIGLAVGEACANAVMHAVSSDSSFLVEAFDRSDKIVVTVSDPGDNTSPVLLRDPDRVGGLGLFLIRRLMDRLSLDMSPDGTKLTMSRRKRAA
jgi:anti-sigma regulatory factor (Ser/Thr protein kinase)